MGHSGADGSSTCLGANNGVNGRNVCTFRCRTRRRGWRWPVRRRRTNHTRLPVRWIGPGRDGDCRGEWSWGGARAWRPTNLFVLFVYWSFRARRRQRSFCAHKCADQPHCLCQNHGIVWPAWPVQQGEVSWRHGLPCTLFIPRRLHHGFPAGIPTLRHHACVFVKGVAHDWALTNLFHSPLVFPRLSEWGEGRLEIQWVPRGQHSSVALRYLSGQLTNW